MQNMEALIDMNLAKTGHLGYVSIPTFCSYQEQTPSSGVMLYGLTHAAQHEPTRTILLAGFLLIVLTLTLLCIYIIRQDITKAKQLRRYGTGEQKGEGA